MDQSLKSQEILTLDSSAINALSQQTKSKFFKTSFETNQRSSEMMKSSIKTINFPDILTDRKRPKQVIIIEKISPKIDIKSETHLRSSKCQSQEKSTKALPLISTKKKIHSLNKIETTPILVDYIKMLSKKDLASRISSNFRKTSMMLKNTTRNRTTIGESTGLSSPDCNIIYLPQGSWQKSKDSLFKQTSSGVICLPLSPKPPKDEFDDYYYISILRNPVFTSFYSILDFQLDTLNNPFPYCGKFNKLLIKKKLPIKKRSSSPAKFNMLCNCNSQPALKFLNLSELRQCIPVLSRVYYHPRNVEYSNKLVIINFEETLGVYKLDLDVRKSTWMCLDRISQNFQLIFVVGNKERAIKEIEKQNLSIAGLYEVQFGSIVNKEIKKLLDYSQIYMDFNCKNPYEMCIVLTEHYFANDESLDSGICVSKGTTQSIVASRIAVACTEYPQAPQHLLFPNFDSHIKRKSLNMSLNSFLSSSFTTFELFSNHPAYTSHQCSKIYSILSKEILTAHPTLQTLQDPNKSPLGSSCRLHLRQILLHPTPGIYLTPNLLITNHLSL